MYVVRYPFNDFLKKNRVRCRVRGRFRVRQLKVKVRHRFVVKVGTYKVHSLPTGRHSVFLNSTGDI